MRFHRNAKRTERVVAQRREREGRGPLHADQEALIGAGMPQAEYLRRTHTGGNARE